MDQNTLQNIIDSIKANENEEELDRQIQQEKAQLKKEESKSSSLRMGKANSVA